MIMEREILICKKTDDTGDKIIGRRRHPIATAQPIIHPKHDAHAQDGVGCANGGKAHQFPIHQVMMQMVHPCLLPCRNCRQAVRSFLRSTQKNRGIIPCFGFSCNLTRQKNPLCRKKPTRKRILCRLWPTPYF